MTVDRFFSQCCMELGIDLSTFTEPDRAVLYERLNEIVNATIMKTKAGVSDRVVQLATGQTYYALGGDVQSVESAILNDSYPITDSEVSISQLRAG